MESIPTFKNRENKKYDIEGKEVWVSRSVAINVAVVVKHMKENQLYLLIGKRGKGTPDFQGYWNVPCGYMDWDEDGTEACYREVWEECGLHLEKFVSDENKFSALNHKHLNNPWKVVTKPTSNRQNISLRYGAFVHALSLPNLTNKYCEKDEVEELEWMPLNDLSDLDSKKWAFNHKQLITDYIKILGLL